MSETAALTYVELHLHTHWSLLDGASSPAELLQRAAELGYAALAITDHDGLYGALEFARTARDLGIQPIAGAEITLIDGSHLTLLAETQAGYRNLCKLITAAHHTHRGPTPDWVIQEHAAWENARDDQDDEPEHYRDPAAAPWLDPALLNAHADGLILLTGCRRGRLARLIDDNRFSEVRDQLREYVDWFGRPNVFVEIQQNWVFGDTARMGKLVQLAQELGVGYVATGNVHYHIPDRSRLQDVLVAIRHRATLDGSPRHRRPNDDFGLCSVAEIKRRFHAYPEAIAASVAIAKRCASFDLNNDLGYGFPDYPTQPGDTPDDTLAKLSWPLFEERYPHNSPRRAESAERLSEELRIIKKRGFAGFFLIHYDLLQLAREVAVEVRGVDSARDRSRLPPGRGRGSSVSSIVCYLIGLSPVDPLEHGLSLGRFLNEESSSIPDIDLDFPRDIRERLIARIHEDYGEKAAMVCAFATYRLRSAVRDVGKALGLLTTDLDRIAKLAEPGSATKLRAELERIPSYAARLDSPVWTQLVDLSAQLAGFPRHISQHSGGMIVSSRPISDMTPVQPAAMAGRFLCQWDKDSCNDAGFVKIDFLALGMLSLVEEAMTLIADVEGQPPDLSRINFADPQVFAMIRRGDTIGTFQVESRAQIQTLYRTQPETLDDLTVQVAIVRPGPIVGGATTPYIERRRQPNYQAVYDHPLLEPVLAETYGVVLYQEQVIDVAVALADFTPGQADLLRRAMTRKRSLEEIEKIRQLFYAGAVRKGVELSVAETVFGKLSGFSSYGFPKAHAASFAVLAYQSCWLKHYYPAEFLTGLLNNQPMGFYPSHVLVNDARRHNLRMLPPDINQSGAMCSVEGRERRMIRIGLSFIDGMSEDAAAAVVHEREGHGPYRSLADFVRRTTLRMAVVENMIAVGAFDGFGLGRREALWQIGLFTMPHPFGRTTAKKAKAQPDRNVGVQTALPLPIEQDSVEPSPTSAWDRMSADYQVMGMSPNYHPLGLLRQRLPEAWATSRELGELPHGSRVRIAGLIVCRQRPGTAKGVTFLSLEDETGLANIVVYPKLYEAQRTLVRGEPFLIVEGVMQIEEQAINIIASRFERLETSFGAPPPESWREELEEPVVEPLKKIAPASHNYR
jgi:error-prone DNA polymerase